MMGSIKGSNSLSRKLSQVGKAIQAVEIDNLKQAALAVRDEAISNIKKPKTGKKYDWRALQRGEKPDRYIELNGKLTPVKDRKKIHISSAPGEAPAEDIGEMTKDIKYYISNKNKNYRVATVVGGFRSAKNLEFGTLKAKARPFLYPAFKAKRKPMLLKLTKDCRQRFKKIGRK